MSSPSGGGAIGTAAQTAVKLPAAPATLLSRPWGDRHPRSRWTSVQPRRKPEPLEREPRAVQRLVGPAPVELGVVAVGHARDERRDVLDPVALEREHVEGERQERGFLVAPLVDADRRLPVDARREMAPAPFARQRAVAQEA